MKFLLALTAVATIVAPSAHAAPHTLFIYESAGQLALRPGEEAAAMAYWEAYGGFSKELSAACCISLQPSATVSAMRWPWLMR